MRKLLLISGFILFVSCNSQDSKKKVIADDSLFLKPDTSRISFEDPIQFKHLIWVPVFDSIRGDVKLKQQRPVKADTLTAEKLIREINASWDGIKLEFRKISHDTIYVAIPESIVLTQQMGSSGAFSYMASTTYILTELKHIKFVDFDFLEGDHVAPGTMKRGDFED